MLEQSRLMIYYLRYASATGNREIFDSTKDIVEIHNERTGTVLDGSCWLYNIPADVMVWNIKGKLLLSRYVTVGESEKFMYGNQRNISKSDRVCSPSSQKSSEEGGREAVCFTFDVGGQQRSQNKEEFESFLTRRFSSVT